MAKKKENKKTYCMIDEDLEISLDIYAIKHSLNIKDVVEKVLETYIHENS